jgi:hypothetical protein
MEAAVCDKHVFCGAISRFFVCSTLAPSNTVTTASSIIETFNLSDYHPLPYAPPAAHRFTQDSNLLLVPSRNESTRETCLHMFLAIE